MSVFGWAVMIATFFSALMAGFLFAFAVVVMRGIKDLSDRDFLRSFQAIDRVIQRGQPLFMAMWLGSSASLVAAAVLAVLYASIPNQAIVITAAATSILLVQLPTMTINIPLNNRLQVLDFDTLDDAATSQARAAFESRWNRWNTVRTVASCAVLATLLLLLRRL